MVIPAIPKNETNENAKNIDFMPILSEITPATAEPNAIPKSNPKRKVAIALPVFLSVDDDTAIV